MGTSQVSLQNRTGILFFMAMNQAFGSSIDTATVIPRQLQVVSRERAAKPRLLRFARELRALARVRRAPSRPRRLAGPLSRVLGREMA